MRNAFASAVIALARRENYFFITGDLGFMALEGVRDAFGARFLNAGVAEQNMFGIAAGLDKNAANFVALSPLSFIERAARVLVGRLDQPNQRGLLDARRIHRREEEVINALTYGTFVGSIVDFAVIAFCVYMIMKALIKEAPAPEPAPTKQCPRCTETIPLAAKTRSCSSTRSAAGRRTR